MKGESVGAPEPPKRYPEDELRDALLKQYGEPSAAPQGAPGGPINVEAIRKRCEAATPGPWRENPLEYHGMVLDRNGYHFAQVDDGGNREFIAHARTDIPALLATVSRQAEEIAELRLVLGRLVGWAEKYPSSRVYSYEAIKVIAADIDTIAAAARALTTTPEVMK